MKYMFFQTTRYSDGIVQYLIKCTDSNYLPALCVGLTKQGVDMMKPC